MYITWSHLQVKDKRQWESKVLRNSGPEIASYLSMCYSGSYAIPTRPSYLVDFHW